MVGLYTGGLIFGGGAYSRRFTVLKQKTQVIVYLPQNMQRHQSKHKLSEGFIKHLTWEIVGSSSVPLPPGKFEMSMIFKNNINISSSNI